MQFLTVPGLALVAALAGLLGDAVTTAIFLQRGGLREGNPVMAWLIEWIGIGPALISSHVAIALGALLLFQGGVLLPIAAIAALFIGATLWNLWNMSRRG